MRKTTFIILFTTMTIFGFSQEDWFGFNRFKADNERIAESDDFPEVVFMGNSITEYWAYYHPDFFSEHHYCGRGIGGQTSTQMLARFTADVVNLHPKVVDNVIAMCQLARANDIVPLIASIPPCASFVWNPDIKDAAQTIVEINERLREFADANNIVYVDYHSALTDEHNAFPKKLSDDGCHPNPDTYFIMEELVLKAIDEALK